MKKKNKRKHSNYYSKIDSDYCFRLKSIAKFATFFFSKKKNCYIFLLFRNFRKCIQKFKWLGFILLTSLTHQRVSKTEYSYPSKQSGVSRRWWNTSLLMHLWRRLDHFKKYFGCWEKRKKKIKFTRKKNVNPPQMASVKLFELCRLLEWLETSCFQ